MLVENVKFCVKILYFSADIKNGEECLNLTICQKSTIILISLVVSKIFLKDRRMKKFLCCFLITIFSFSVVFAGGKKDVDERDLGEKNSWQETFDINDKETGKYNIMIEATDQAGNLKVEGPYNIIIDQESDLPVSGITNPSEQMRITGNLNVVGTCIDDDAVDHVNIIFDGDEDNMQLAEGKEFWSAYLDTNDLAEGPHTIEVFGTDINGLRGHSTKITWQLDRRAPVTTITNYTMGQLVSGKIELTGTIEDGNGIAQLKYSFDDEYFTEVKINQVKLKEPDEQGRLTYWTFNLPIDTKKFDDGPKKISFKARDNAGSIGDFAFLVFIDNTPPDVQIVYPLEDEAVNGIFSVAGYAKDTVGLQSISWQYGEQGGQFELIPGNPYWVAEVNTIGVTKAQDFVVNAVDIAGNVVNLKQKILLDQEADKPVVTVTYPEAEGNVEGLDGTMYIRGIVADDDGTASIAYSIDGGEEQTLECTGVFYADIPGDLANGPHTLAIYATDINGVKGNVLKVPFTAKGVSPQFENELLASKTASEPYVNGMLINPEADQSYTVDVVSTCGLSALSYSFAWGYDNTDSVDVTLKGGEKKVTVTVPMTNVPWGVSELTVKATDIFQRVSEHKVILATKDLTRLYGEEPGVFFNDSVVGADGAIKNDPYYPVTGYFLGGYIDKVELVPPTPAAEAQFDGNIITLYPGEGGSGPVVVRVTTDTGAQVDSRQIYFIAEAGDPPLLDLYDESEEIRTPLEPGNTNVTMEGKTEPGVSVSYKIFSAAVEYTDGVVTGSHAEPIPHDMNTVTVQEDGSFSFEIPTYKIPDGMTVVEVVATNESGMKTVKSFEVRKIADAPEGAKIAAPAIYWLEDINLYAVALYQGELDVTFDVFESENWHAGNNDFTFTVTPLATAKPVMSKYTAKKSGAISARMNSVNGSPYQSGMTLALARGASKEITNKATVSVKSPVALVNAEWKLVSDEKYGGEANQVGAIDLKKAVAVDDMGEEYEFDIPIQNLPAGIVHVFVTVTNIDGDTAELQSTLGIIRDYDTGRIDDDSAIYWKETAGCEYDAAGQRYILDNGAPLVGYANLYGPLTAELANPVEGLEAVVEGNIVKINATVDGVYENVEVKVTDAIGAVYTSPAVNLIVDTANPVIELTAPEVMAWSGETLHAEGTVSDGNGIDWLEVSYDAMQTWKKIEITEEGTFSFDENIAFIEDGIVPVDFHAVDKSGKETYLTRAVQKDTTPPEVRVIVPESLSRVNGENRIAFLVKDAGVFSKFEYVPMLDEQGNPMELPEPPAEEPVYDENGVQIGTTGDEGCKLSSLPTTLVGLPYRPIDNKMRFAFTDAVGNETLIDTWEFTVDPESDLPVADINLPVENQVITRDFVLSGVIYDDDGSCRTYYKLDDGEYQMISDYASSFEHTIFLSDLTDNEHTLTVYAEDIHGVIGPEVVRTIRVSLEEPKGEMLTPEISQTVKDTVTLTGVASDKNGISKVQISVDNGSSYNDAIGTEEWSYTFSTKAIQDGTHVVFIKIYDGYEITGTYSSLINIDNTFPVLSLELPMDDSKATHYIAFSGETTDNIGLTDLYITVRSLEGKEIPEELAKIELVPDAIISQVTDITSLEDGFYNIELTGTDAAGNTSRVSRNIQVDKTTPLTKVELLYPLNGEHVQGTFNIYGTATSEEDPIASVTLYIDGKVAQNLENTTPSDSGYFRFNIKPNTEEFGTDTFTEGQHSYKVIATTETGKQVESNEQYLIYGKLGPWVTLDNFTYGDFAVERPMLRGDAGYEISQEEKDSLKDKNTLKEKKEAIEAKSVKQVYISLNNGKTFTPVSKKNKGKWEYRVENEDIAAGYHFMLIKAEMNDGTSAITRLLVQVDHTYPSIRLISPGEGGHYNQYLEFSGLTGDDIALKNVRLYLRSGDKNSYGIPAFFQGLYFEGGFWGASLWDIGAGLTFMDDAVKVQISFGQFTQGQRNAVQKVLGQKQTNFRFGGNIISGKIIAQLYVLPFMSFLGRDWEWLTATFSLGANFSMFTESGAGTSQMLSAVLGQIEFPRVTMKKLKNFKTWSFFFEPQLWFIPSDVVSEDAKKVVFTFTFGIRTDVF